MTALFDSLAQDNWHLFLGVLLAFLVIRFVTWRIDNRPVASRFPALVALLDLLVLPGMVIVAGTLLRLGAAVLEVPDVDAGIRSLTLLVAHLAAGWAVARLIEVVLLVRADDDLSERVPKLVVGLIYVAMMLFGLAIYLWQRGYSFTGIWVSTGVAAAVLGLALQKTLGDLFSGIALGVERPFRLGDWVELNNGIVGQVIDLNWRSTRLRGWDNSTHIIPNSQMAGQPIKNLHDDQHLYAPWYFVKLPAEIDPRFATALMLEAAMRCESVLKFPYPVVRLSEATTVPYVYMVWVHLKNYPAMFRAREELFREIHRSLQDAGIEMAPEVREMRTRRAHVSHAEPPSILLALKGLDVSGLLTADELEEVAARGVYCHYDSGHVILADGAQSDAFYVVAGGLVEAVVTLPDRSRKVTETLGPGKHFGITSMLTNDPSFLEFTAKSDVSLIRIDLDCVRRIVAARPELAERLAGVVKARLDTAEAARTASRQPVRRLSLRDISRRIETVMVRPNRFYRGR
ncbi:mechanosensitive ion channel family protein [Marichromatium gracile]|uniref:Small-conductance mechanosensitive channel n=1 Tax=Marichromatium gracile TaxID=1048 RepID=A0ABR5VIC0_MARGR|nr:mechanosensitive ion channel family protein [Marichromatium gracile]KXX65155.1 mechanosensitive ion channel protein MscS [Marichromatium gracile]